MEELTSPTRTGQRAVSQDTVVPDTSIVEKSTSCMKSLQVEENKLKEKAAALSLTVDNHDFQKTTVTVKSKKSAKKRNKFARLLKSCYHPDTRS